MTEETGIEEKFDQLPEDKKEELFDMARSIESKSHAVAMDHIEKAMGPLPEGYKFSHFIVQIAGRQKNSAEVTEVMEFAKDAEYRLEITALYKNPLLLNTHPDKCHRRSILYLNPGKNAVYLNGQEVQGELDPNELLSSMLAHKFI